MGPPGIGDGAPYPRSSSIHWRRPSIVAARTTIAAWAVHVLAHLVPCERAKPCPRDWSHVTAAAQTPHDVDDAAADAHEDNDRDQERKQDAELAVAIATLPVAALPVAALPIAALPVAALLGAALLGAALLVAALLGAIVVLGLVGLQADCLAKICDLGGCANKAHRIRSATETASNLAQDRGRSCCFLRSHLTHHRTEADEKYPRHCNSPSNFETKRPLRQNL